MTEEKGSIEVPGKPVSLDDFNLDEKDRTLLRYLIRNPTAKQKELAALIGYTASSISSRVRRPRFVAALREIRRTTDDLLEVAQKEAALKIVDLVHSKDERIAFNACKFLLSIGAVSKGDLNATQEMTWSATINEDGAITQKLEHKLKQENLLNEEVKDL